MFRPGFIQPLHGVRSKTPLYSVFYALRKPLIPLRFALPNFILTTEEIGAPCLLWPGMALKTNPWRAGIFALYCIPNSAQDTASNYGRAS